MNHAQKAVDFVLSSAFSIWAGALSVKTTKDAWEKRKLVKDVDPEQDDIEIGWVDGDYEDRSVEEVRFESKVEFVIGVASGVLSAGFGAQAASIVGDYL